MKNFLLSISILFTFQALDAQTCSGGAAAESISLDLTGLNSAGLLGASGNSSGNICFPGGSLMDVVGIEWADIDLNPIGTSWCSETTIDLNGDVSFTPAPTEGNVGPCNNGYSSGGLLDLDALGLTFGTDASGCITWEAYETLDDDDGATPDQIFSNGLVTFYGCPPGAILPIELIWFSAKQRELSNLIEWSTSQEINNFEMIVQKSSDLSKWEEVGRKQSRGNTNFGATYVMEDTNPYALTYYRLKSVDLDGSIQYSDVINVQRTTEQFTVRRVGPNPLIQDLELTIESDSELEANVLVHNIDGKLISVQEGTIQRGISTLLIDMQDLLTGVYRITVITDSGLYTCQVVKQ